MRCLMMLNPAIGKLINNYKNRYELVLDIAKRARKISEKAEKEQEIIIEKPVTLAMNQLAKEKDLL